MKAPNEVFSGQGTTIFTVMSALAVEEGAINLGQGFPDEDGPEEIRRAAAQALLEGPNQYPPMQGVPELRQAVAGHNKRFYGLEIDWASEVLVTSGATEALADCLFGLLSPGDEVVLIEPLYDSYLPIVNAAGATAKFVRLDPPYWRISEEQLSAAFSEKTKLVLFNSPMNPIGKVFTDAELEMIAKYIDRFDTYAICDEVYEHLVFDEHTHTPLMTLPGMRERTARIGSAGKTFSLTGWKIGYITAPAKMMNAIAKTHQFVTFTTPPALQKAIALGLNKERDYFDELAKDMQRKRDLLSSGLAQIGFDILPCHGTYFLIGDYSAIDAKRAPDEMCKRLTTDAKVASIPLTSFYVDGQSGQVLRFCFCKRADVLEEAIDKLTRFFSG